MKFSDSKIQKFSGKRLLRGAFFFIKIGRMLIRRIAHTLSFKSTGVKNQLGVIRFLFRNKYFVYMNDTPDSFFIWQANKNF